MMLYFAALSEGKLTPLELQTNAPLARRHLRQ